MSWDSRPRHEKPGKRLAKMRVVSVEVGSYQTERSPVQSRDVRIGPTRVMVAEVSHSTISQRSGKKKSWLAKVDGSQSANPVIAITRKSVRTTSEKLGNQRFLHSLRLKEKMANKCLARYIPK
tara:strand:+ start:1196 stop:1564 length:369 start_codon:yes stop_codon:yes gene_type:complete